LADENTTLRHLVLTTVNQLQTISHDVRLLQSASDEEVRYFTTFEAIGLLTTAMIMQPTPYNLAALFPLSPRLAAYETLKSILSTLRQSVSTLSIATTSTTSNSSPTTSSKAEATADEMKRLHTVIDTLRAELGDHFVLPIFVSRCD
jgi:hypothetical protein